MNPEALPGERLLADDYADEVAGGGRVLSDQRHVMLTTVRVRSPGKVAIYGPACGSKSWWGVELSPPALEAPA